MPPEEIDSLAEDVKPLVLKLLRQISGLTARVDELVAQNKALLVARLFRRAAGRNPSGQRHHADGVRRKAGLGGNVCP
jgi:hypothetical protein